MPGSSSWAPWACSTPPPRCSSAWCMSICPSWCCPSTPTWKNTTRPGWMPPGTWGPGPGRASGASPSPCPCPACTPAPPWCSSRCWASSPFPNCWGALATCWWATSSRRPSWTTGTGPWGRRCPWSSACWCWAWRAWPRGPAVRAGAKRERSQAPPFRRQRSRPGGAPAPGPVGRCPGRLRLPLHPPGRGGAVLLQRLPPQRSLGGLHHPVVCRPLRGRCDAGGGGQLAVHRRARQHHRRLPGDPGRHRHAPLPHPLPALPGDHSGGHAGDPPGGVPAAVLPPGAGSHPGLCLHPHRPHHLFHRLRRHRGAGGPGGPGREPAGSGPGPGGDALAGLPPGDPAPHPAQHGGGLAGGLHPVHRRLRHHLLHRRGGGHDAPPADLFHDQGGGLAGSQCRVHPAHGPHPQPRGPGLAPGAPPPGGAAMRWLLLVLALVAGTPRAEEVLNLYNWNNYISDATLQRFEARCRCRVRQDFYSDNEEMLAKLDAGAIGYDILVPTGYAVEALIRRGALRPLDKSRLPHLANIRPEYLDTWYDPGNRYSVPYAYTITLLGYNATRLRALGLPTDTWALIFEPKYLEKLKGRVSVLNSQRELFGAALRYLGYSVPSRNPREWEQAKELILRAKPYWATFSNSTYIKDLAIGNLWVAHGYSNDMFRAQADARDAGRPFAIGFSTPKEGAVLAVDNWVVHKDAPHPELAQAFIDFMLEGENAADVSNLIGAGTPNAAAMSRVTPAVADNPAIFPGPADFGRLEMLRDADARSRRLLSRMWTEIKVR